ncbi:MAG: hypothetical protein WCG59_08910 [Actinomycetes bacterium]
MARSLFEDVPGQEDAVALLRSALVSPVHAYLFVGPEGCGIRTAAKDFAAALLCREGGCGECNDCERVRSGFHPDLTVLERAGASYAIEDVRSLTGIAQRRPLEATRTVIIIPEAELMGLSAPALLKTLEEPATTTVFLLLANEIPREMATIRSRCVEVPFKALSIRTIATWLTNNGVEEEIAESLAEGSAGDAERALLLANDEGFVQRLSLWRHVPDVLDGSGSTAAELAIEVQGSLSESIAPLVTVHEAEIAFLEEQAKAMGERGIPKRKELTDRHKREEKRYLTTELIAGLGVLSRRYRDRLIAAEREGGPGSPETIRKYMSSIDAISRLSTSLRRNPRQLLAIERLFLELS